LSVLTLLPQPNSPRPSKRTNNTKPSRLDLTRYAKWRAGTSDEDIAQNEPKGPRDVGIIRESIQRVLAWQQINSLPMVTTAAHEVILKHIPTVDRIIEDFGRATKTRKVTEIIDGKEVSRDVVEIDYATQARVLESLKDLRDMVASKESKTNVNFGTQVAGNVNLTTRSFEDRIRKKREARGLKDEEDSIGEAEIIQDAEFDEELEEEEDESPSPR
jgi:hypothetical protein